MLEIGVQNGGSLEIWAEYFHSNSIIVGCDIDKNCHDLEFNNERIKVVIGDINHKNTCDEIFLHQPFFDIIIDDGSHQCADIIRTFCQLFTRLNDGGIFVIEDLHASYWYKFGGGLHHPKSAISFFKMLIDVINFEHWGIDLSPNSYLFSHGFDIEPEFLETLDHIHSIEFINSVCFIRKEDPKSNLLGTRVVAGDLEVLSSNRKYHGMQNAVQNQRSNPLSNLDCWREPHNCQGYSSNFEGIADMVSKKLNERDDTICNQQLQLQKITDELNRAEAQLEMLKELLLLDDHADRIQ